LKTSRITRLAGALALISLALPAAAGASPIGKTTARTFPCRDAADVAHELTLKVDGQEATGHYSVPDSAPSTMVVFAHGYGHTSASWVEHMKNAARDHGVAAATMDYRGAEISPDSNGDGLPESRGWNVMAGAEDSIAVAQAFEASCPSIDNFVIFGVSMGGNTAGLVAALQGERGITDSEGDPLFDYWYNIEGATNVTETYFSARTLAPVNSFAANAVVDIEKEMGGPFENDPAPYQERTVVSRMDDIEAAGIDGVVVVHGLDDGLVPYNQGREMAGLLAAAGIDTDMYTIGRKSPESERETTASGYVMGNVDPNYRSPLAGHGSEKSQTHIVMVTAFESLWSLIDDGNTPGGPYREFFVDGEAGTFPLLP
jgi:pimeloyl-ACP methyl ester carboxylesterase